MYSLVAQGITAGGRFAAQSGAATWLRTLLVRGVGFAKNHPWITTWIASDLYQAGDSLAEGVSTLIDDIAEVISRGDDNANSLNAEAGQAVVSELFTDTADRAVFRHLDTMTVSDVLGQWTDYGFTDEKSPFIRGAAVIRALADAGPRGHALFLSALDALKGDGWNLITQFDQYRMTARLTVMRLRLTQPRAQDFADPTLFVKRAMSTNLIDGALADLRQDAYSGAQYSALRPYTANRDRYAGTELSVKKPALEGVPFASFLLPEDPRVLLSAFGQAHSGSTQHPLDLIHSWRAEVAATTSAADQFVYTLRDRK